MPFYPVSHQQGHIAAAAWSAGRLELLDRPMLAWHLSGGTTELLLVVPETDVTRYRVDYKLAAGDRVMLGEGPEVEWAAWPSFVPAEVDGLGAITYVLPLYLRGAVHHVEAGAWWSAGGAGAGRLAR